MEASGRWRVRDRDHGRGVVTAPTARRVRREHAAMGGGDRMGRCRRRRRALAREAPAAHVLAAPCVKA